MPRPSIVLLLSLASLSAAEAQAPTRRDSASTLPVVEVIGRGRSLDRIPGSGQRLDSLALAPSRAFTTNEVLRRVPGVFVRDEEGVGLRPNIGIRGLNPTRSSKVLLLEDGVPLTIAPYGDNASYYHPPVDRFSSIEVLKGSGQIAYGPQTVGGVINYLTPAPPSRTSGTLQLVGGSRDYRNVQAKAGGTAGALGWRLDGMYKSADGARANTGTTLGDVVAKGVMQLGGGQSLTVKGDWYRERSQVTYSGLTEGEYDVDPLQNPFVNDSMFLDRLGAMVAHRAGSGTLQFATTAYAYRVNRDWWRQSSNSAQRPNDRSDPACGGMDNLSLTCGNEGRLRGYRVAGLEPRMRAVLTTGPVAHALDAGVRVHVETQSRRQVNGGSPDAREAADAGDVNGGLKERNRRRALAYSAYVQDRVALGPVTLSPGIRVEHVRLARENVLAAKAGSTTLTEVVPGVGATWQAAERATVFAGVHRGFAPPRVEDVIDNASGATIELAPERSVNYELGVRASPVDGVQGELTAFRMDFSNQVVPASVAGGVGATVTNGGRTLHQGVELSGRLDLARLAGTPDGLYVDAAWTWMPTAEFRGERYVYVGAAGVSGDVAGKVYDVQNATSTRARTSVTGNRLPYAPEHLFTGALGYAHRRGADVRVEMVHTSRQFGDALNTPTLVPDGQQGELPAWTIWNASASWRIDALRNTVFLSVRNLADRRYVVDRTRGLLPGLPRMVQAGIRQDF